VSRQIRCFIFLSSSEYRRIAWWVNSIATGGGLVNAFARGCKALGTALPLFSVDAVWDFGEHGVVVHVTVLTISTCRQCTHSVAVREVC